MKQLKEYINTTAAEISELEIKRDTNEAHSKEWNKINNQITAYRDRMMKKKEVLVMKQIINDQNKNIKKYIDIVSFRLKSHPKIMEQIMSDMKSQIESSTIEA